MWQLVVGSMKKLGSATSKEAKKESIKKGSMQRNTSARKSPSGRKIVMTILVVLLGDDRPVGEVVYVLCGVVSMVCVGELCDLCVVLGLLVNVWGICVCVWVCSCGVYCVYV